MRRRSFLGAATGVTAIGAAMGGRPAWAAETLTVVSFGGAYQAAQSKALFQPAAKALGIIVK